MTLDRSYDHHDDVLRRDRGERERGVGGGREREFMLKREGGGWRTRNLYFTRIVV